jgi:homogentisate 1,2-dioxygenase
MPIYRRLGEVPPKRHTQFRRPDGQLYAEELFGTQGFAGVSSLLYHYHPPTRVTEFHPAGTCAPEAWPQATHRHHHLRTAGVESHGDPITARRVLLFNADVAIGVAAPDAPMGYFYRNARADEILFVHAGTGVLRSVFGNLPFRAHDYLVIPRGTTYRLDLDAGPHRFLFVESNGPVEIPRRYRNDLGQLLEHAPYCERDLRAPTELETHTEAGDFEVRVKVGDRLMAYCYAHHPCDVVGWDGYLYPWALSIDDFEPITGRIHQPPPVHQTFAGPGFVLCSFVPRRLDYHPLAIPAPYNHSNIDSEEVMYYVSGTYTARRGIEAGSISYHPGGIPHGPHPGAAEASIGREWTDELAVMIDTFKPLQLTRHAEPVDDPRYPYSWLEQP